MIETPRFSDEDMKALYKAEIHFTSVLKSSTLKGAPAWLTKEVAKIYEKTFNKRLNKNYNCQVCAFSVYRIVGEAYFKQLNEQKEKEAQLNEQKEKEKSTVEIQIADDKKDETDVKPTVKSTKKSKKENESKN